MFGTAAKALLGLAAVVGVIIFFYNNQQRIAADKAKLELEKAVSVLPPGVEEAWFAYVDRRLAKAIQRRSGSVLVAGMIDGAMNQTTFVSSNTPYKVTCSPLLGASVEFGHGEGVTSVPIYGILVWNHSAEGKPPELGVHESSVAAIALSKRLCDRISQSVSRILGH